MDDRREFIKKAALFSGALCSGLPGAIERAMAIEPAPGSSYLDAEHVVILMQENRSFDHAFGRLRGVRGFQDPRAIQLPNGNPVWVQSNEAGDSFAPFRLNIKDTNATWMGSLPHSWTDQVDARNGGACDRWLEAKASGHADYADMPLTLGYYDRNDIPFYYALADAFTICDQHFCSALTGTTANRLYLWTGTIRGKEHSEAWPHVFNSDVDYDREAHWTTFPERLEDLGISWRVYQNELTLASGLTGEHDAWLTNFSDNPLEWFSQYNVRFAESHRAFVDEQVDALQAEISAIEQQVTGESDESAKLLAEKRAALAKLQDERKKWNPQRFAELSQRAKDLHSKAFTTNRADANYRQLAEASYTSDGHERKMLVPEGDVLRQFRDDVRSDNLPTVSWLVPPERYSDHPGSPWYGAWYIAEVMDILTERPEIWQKTIFLLTYDENDGYFDHIPPFAPPRPSKPNSGQVSKGIDVAEEYVTLDDERKRRPADECRESAIGLGYRVPLVIASPWSRGGCVCSQVFDHTSPLQFLEQLLSHKTGKKVEESNISKWRRTVCGNLTAAFQPSADASTGTLAFPDRDSFLEQIYEAQFKELPAGWQKLSPEQIAKSQQPGWAGLPTQEPGVRPSSPLPYELQVDGKLSEDRRRFHISFAANNERFGSAAAGAPFIVYARLRKGDVAVRNYAVAPGNRLEDSWNLHDFAGGHYDISVYGPNGFFRKFTGSSDDPAVSIRLREERVPGRGASATGNIELCLETPRTPSRCNFLVVNHMSQSEAAIPQWDPARAHIINIDCQQTFHWYDVDVRIDEQPDFLRKYAGRVETGAWGFSDPTISPASRPSA